MSKVRTVDSFLVRSAAFRLLLLPALIGAFGLPGAASSQTTFYTQTAQALKKTVHLRLGATTLAKTVKALSDQTGLHIQAAGYLQERRMVVELGDMSAGDALNALAECHDWSWTEHEKGNILITRPGYVDPQNLTQIAPAFHAIVPKDLRRFIGLDVAESEMRAAYAQDHPDAKEKIVKYKPLPFLTSDRIGAPVETAQYQMISWLTPEVKAGKKLACADLSPKQRQQLIAIFVCEAMQKVIAPGPGSAKGIIMGIDPRRLDPTQMLIRTSGTLLLGGTFTDGHVSFGESIEPDMPDPLRQHTEFGP